MTDILYFSGNVKQKLNEFFSVDKNDTRYIFLQSILMA